MSSFKALKDVCVNFDEQLRGISDNLFSAKIGDSSEIVIGKKLKTLSLFSSKYHLIHAKETALTPQIAERVQSEGVDINNDYEEAAQRVVLERAIVKSLTQSRAVQTLLSTPSRKLDPEMVARKEKITSALNDFRNQESELKQLDALHHERSQEYSVIRDLWHEELGQLRDMRASATPEDGVQEAGPLYQKLRTLVDKMQMMKWLLGRLVSARSTKYDWLSDPHKRLAVLPLTREDYTVAAFTNDDSV